MDKIFKLIVDKSKLNPNFTGILEPCRKVERELLLSWTYGFVDRDGKFVKEFQTTFNSSFWEIYLYALMKDYGFDIDWGYSSPDFNVKAGNAQFVVEATTANAAQGKPNEWDKKFDSAELKNICFFELNKESIIRLSNSISAKYKKFKESYSKLKHVRNKPFVIAVAPFEQPNFSLQYNRPIVALLYDYYVDEDNLFKRPGSSTWEPSVKQLGSVEKDNGAEVCLGLFNDDALKEISAVIFSCTATWGKLTAMSNPDKAVKCVDAMWATPPNGKPIRVNASTPGYKEEIFDGIQIYHNPYASIPLPVEIFKRDRVVQEYLNKDTREWVIEGKCDALLYRQALTLFGAR